MYNTCIVSWIDLLAVLGEYLGLWSVVLGCSFHSIAVWWILVGVCLFWLEAVSLCCEFGLDCLVVCCFGCELRFWWLLKGWYNIVFCVFLVGLNVWRVL